MHKGCVMCHGSYNHTWLYSNLCILDCTSGDITLVGGETEREGRVEMCVFNKWGTFCGKYWTSQDTAVVCRQLGFSTGE